MISETPLCRNDVEMSGFGHRELLRGAVLILNSSHLSNSIATRVSFVFRIRISFVGRGAPSGSVGIWSSGMWECRRGTKCCGGRNAGINSKLRIS
jgi:hypothetical protein